MIVPKIPVGVSGTALAASLLRSGWSVSDLYLDIFCWALLILNGLFPIDLLY